MSLILSKGQDLHLAENGVKWLIYFCVKFVESFGNRVSSMLSQKLGHGRGVKFATRETEALSEFFRLFKNGLGDGDGCFHVGNMSFTIPDVKKGKMEKRETRPWVPPFYVSLPLDWRQCGQFPD